MLASLGPARAADPRSVFIHENICEITGRLHAIHLSPKPTDRFLIVAVHDRPQAYVQCLLSNQDQEILCEASSGFYARLPGEPRDPVPPAVLALMEAAGFSTDASEGNFQRLRNVDAVGPTFQDTAETLLGLLYDAYGARRGTELEYTSPLARPDAMAAEGCAPRLSGPDPSRRRPIG